MTVPPSPDPKPNPAPNSRVAIATQVLCVLVSKEQGAYNYVALCKTALIFADVLIRTDLLYPPEEVLQWVDSEEK